MKHADVVEAIGVLLFLVAIICMAYSLWVIGGPPAWFGAGALLFFLSLVLIGVANRGEA